MTDARLVGTNPETSELVPVAVNAMGQLKTEAAKIEEIPNDVLIDGTITVNQNVKVGGTLTDLDGNPIAGGDGGGGGGIELPPNPQDGQVLGWMDGGLAWLDIGFSMKLEYLVIAGGGAASTPPGGSYPSGGGAGGYISGVTGEKSGGGANSAGPLSLELIGGGMTFDITAGTAGEDSIFSGPTWNFQAKAGGTWDNSDGLGGSGAGGAQDAGGTDGGPGGAGTAEQGYKGADGSPWGPGSCASSGNWCHPVCSPYNGGRGGGGAGGAGSFSTAGIGVTSSITGSPVTYAAGGRGSSLCASEPPEPVGRENFGSGASPDYGAQPGAVILRYPSFAEVSPGMGATFSVETVDDGSYKVSTITNGQGTLICSLSQGYFRKKLEGLKAEA